MLNDQNIRFNVEDVTLRDDAYHKTVSNIRAEWWYFDAVFDNKFSANVNIAVFSRRNFGIVIPVLNIYKNSKPVFRRREIRCFREFSASEDGPNIVLSKDDIIKGYISKPSENWNYDISLSVGGQKIDLKFVGLMKGWKGVTPGSQWGVMLPRALVEGTITLNGKIIKVNGVGYHDHNWDFNPIVKQHGWYWGRFGGEKLNLVWANILLTRSKYYLLAVLNEGRSNYININPEKIQFDIIEYTRDRGKNTT